MRSAGLFVVGIAIGAALTSAGTAQDARPRSLNHVGIAVRNYEAAIDFYERAMGFKMAYSLKRPDGSPLLTYLQVNRDTFLEILPAGPSAATGLTHFGVEYGDIRAEVARLRQQGVTVADPGLTPAAALFSRITDLEGNAIEVMEFGPGALQRKAMDAWK